MYGTGGGRETVFFPFPVVRLFPGTRLILESMQMTNSIKATYQYKIILDWDYNFSDEASSSFKLFVV